MSSWFLSYNSQDLAPVQALAARLRGCATSTSFSPPVAAGRRVLATGARRGHRPRPDAFVLVVGDRGLGPWQLLEYYEALDRRVKAPGFPIILLLLDGQPAPGLPFLRQLHWIVAPDLTAEPVIGQLRDAVAGAASRPGERWRHTAPYRGLAAMTEADSDFFFGRADATLEVLRSLAAARTGCRS